MTIFLIRKYILVLFQVKIFFYFCFLCFNAPRALQYRRLTKTTFSKYMVFAFCIVSVCLLKHMKQ